jgi:hypothetical protein
MRQRKPRISKPSNRGGARRTPSAQVRAREVEKAVVEFRLRGWSYSRIAEEMDLSISGAHSAYWRALDRTPAESVSKMRAEALARIERLRARLWEHESRGKLPIRAAAVLAMLEAQQAKIFGLVSAVEFDPDAIPASEFTDRDKMTKLIQTNLTVDEQRLMLRLMRKAHGQPDATAIETTSTQTPPAPVPAEPGGP